MRATGLVGIVPFAAGLCLAASGCGKAPAPVAGQVVTSDGKPVWGVAVGFWTKEKARQPFTAVTDPQGRFSLACPAGEYQVTVLPPSAKGAGRGWGVGPLPSAGKGEGGNGPVQPAVPKPYWRSDTSPLRVTVPAGGVKDVLLEVQDLSDTAEPR
jgi:hypothetical protein